MSIKAPTCHQTQPINRFPLTYIYILYPLATRFFRILGFVFGWGGSDLTIKYPGTQARFRCICTRRICMCAAPLCVLLYSMSRCFRLYFFKLQDGEPHELCRAISITHATSLSVGQTPDSRPRRARQVADIGALRAVGAMRAGDSNAASHGAQSVITLVFSDRCAARGTL